MIANRHAIVDHHDHVQREVNDHMPADESDHDVSDHDVSDYDDSDHDEPVNVNDTARLCEELEADYHSIDTETQFNSISPVLEINETDYNLT